MANRPVFVAIDSAPFYKQVNVEFTYFSGFAVSQKQKSITSLHESAKKKEPKLNPLEISTKSTELLGINLSAFNLKYIRNGNEYSIESIFQGSKVFACGGPYTDIYNKEPKDAKRDDRLGTSGRIIHFSLEGVMFSNEPKDYFYNWIYSSALYSHPDMLKKLVAYNAFTDIEFNPEKSINCQARTVAIVCGLMNNNLLDEAMKSPEDYLRIVYNIEKPEPVYEQISLF